MSAKISSAPCGVHFVGSFPHNALERPSDVFATAMTKCPGRVRRIPDGEIGDIRAYYVLHEDQRFPKEILLSSNSDMPTKLDPSFKLSLEDVTPVHFGHAAIESYKQFVKCRNDGIIPYGVRFQVSLPTPMESLIHVHPAYRAEAAPLYEQRMFEAVAMIQDHIPAADLAIQWDAAVIIGQQEYERGRISSVWFLPWSSDVFGYCMDAMERAASQVKQDVELGFHLCYGDNYHNHNVEPEDMSLLVKNSNELVRRVEAKHHIAWMHMPVPIDRSDDAYFAPLHDLVIPDNTQLMLGLVHAEDLEGTRKRITVAQRAWSRGFGVGTECGLGRTPPEQLDDILDICSKVCEPYGGLGNTGA